MARGKSKRVARTKQHAADASDEDCEVDEEGSSYEDKLKVQEEGEDKDEKEHDGDWDESKSRLRKERLVAGEERRSLTGSQKRRRGSGEEQKGEFSWSGLEDGSGKRARRIAGKESCIAISSASHDDEEKKGADQRGEKGKSKEKVVNDGVGEEAKASMQETEDVCGVCLIEQGKTERGILDCCDHYFCYTCIMEWAKVESRCPLCKQRFVNIVRPGLAARGRSRMVRIPLRDQVYLPSEEEVRGFEDTYANIVCMECHETGEERLLLLCDLCDAAAHTYCVGLGRSVPHGDWFCRSCQVVVPESSSDEKEDLILGFNSDDDEEHSMRAIMATPIPVAQQSGRQISAVMPATLFTRPRRRRRGVRRRLRRRLTHHDSSFATSALRFSQTVRSLGRQCAEFTGCTGPQISDQQTGIARTVPNQRRLQERIQIIRENWEEIRRGTMQFPSGGHNLASSPLTLPSLGEKTATSLRPQSRPDDRSSTSGDDRRHPTGLSMDSNASFPSQHVTGCKKEPDIAQAWIMLEHAKTLGEGSSFIKRTSLPFPLLSRQESTRAKQITGFTPKAPMVLQDRVGSRSHLSVVSQKMNNAYESVVKQSELGGKSGESETVLCNFREEHQNHMKECTTGSNSKNSTNVNVLESALAEENEAGIRISGKSGAISSSRCSEDGNHIETPFVKESSGGSVDDVGTKCSRLQSSNDARLSDFVSETGHGNSLTSQCNLLSTPEVPQICIEHKCSTVALYTALQEADNLNIKELALSNEGSGLESANTNLGRHKSVSTHCTHVANKSWKTHGMGSSASSHEPQQTASQVALSTCKNTFDHSSITEKIEKFEHVKDRVAHIVKTELWPIYLSKGLGKEQFKQIARSATHACLAICGLEHHKPNFPQVKDLSCCHKELQGRSPIANFCDSCLKVQVQDVVRTLADTSLALSFQ